MKKYKVSFYEWIPYDFKPIRKEVDLVTNAKEEAVSYISDISSANNYGEPNFKKASKGVYIWTIDGRTMFTINFKYITT